MGKHKDQVNGEAGDGESSGTSWEEKIANLNAIAKPLASRKLTKKIYKTLKKAYKVKQLEIGIKTVQTGLRKGKRGLVVFAGDVFPVDIICHLPLVCEELGVPYCYVPSRDDLGSSFGMKRQAAVIMMKEHEDYIDSYNEVVASVQQLPPPL